VSVLTVTAPQVATTTALRHAHNTAIFNKFRAAVNADTWKPKQKNIKLARRIM
jgi:hypothetical protein